MSPVEKSLYTAAVMNQCYPSSAHCAANHVHGAHTVGGGGLRGLNLVIGHPAFITLFATMHQTWKCTTNRKLQKKNLANTHIFKKNK